MLRTPIVFPVTATVRPRCRKERHFICISKRSWHYQQTTVGLPVVSVQIDASRSVCARVKIGAKDYLLLAKFTYENTSATSFCNHLSMYSQLERVQTVNPAN